MTSARPSLNRGTSFTSIKSAIQSVARFRWLIFTLGTFANFGNAVVGSSLSLTIVAMIQKQNELPINGTDEILIEETTNNAIHVDWSNVDKSRMLQASFWGTLVMSLFGGRFCEYVGPRRIISVSLLIIGLVNLLFPVVSIHSFVAAYLLRIIQGLCTGTLHPAAFVLATRWSTDSERTLSNAYISCGGSLGNLISLPLAGILVDSSFLGGWPSVFYVFGTYNLIMGVIWYILVYDLPEDHPYLSRGELEEILKSRSVKSGNSVSVPWIKILTSIPVLVYLIPGFTYGWAVAVVASQIPSFYEDVLGFSHTSNGFVASLPWLVGMATQLIGSALVDRIRRKNKFSLASIRKVATAIALGVCSFGLVIVPSLGSNKIPVVLTIAFCKGMGTLTVAGVGINHLDIAPSFAGTLAGFYGAMHSLSSLAANEGAARIIGNEPTPQNWYRFFYLSAAINISGIVLFAIFGSGVIQPWDPASKNQNSVNNLPNNELKSKGHKEESHENAVEISTI